MKKIWIAFFALSILAACNKDALILSPTDSSSDGANLRVHYYSPAPNGNYILKMDTAKIGGTFFYSQVGPTDGASYFSVKPGTGTAKFVIPQVGTKVDSIVVNTFNYTLEKGKYYSLFVIDTAIKTKALFLNDNLALPAFGKAKVRFVNTMYNVPAMDIKLTDGTALASGLAFGSATDFIELTANQVAAIRFYNPGTAVQLTGTSSSTFVLNLTPGDRRIYTVALRGVAGSTATVPVVTTITNR